MVTAGLIELFYFYSDSAPPSDELKPPYDVEDQNYKGQKHCQRVENLECFFFPFVSCAIGRGDHQITDARKQERHPRQHKTDSF